ncbi:MAG: RbcX chaperonin protein [Spirulina sp. DLM2.Bin59]|nr:MAG: RbcX chaperonin protein [Spirulina sp. DLM2.Bin59]
MNPKHIAENTVQVLQSYLTYQAVREIIHQLNETNPPQALWLTQYSAGKLQDGEAYLNGLMLEHKELVLRILTVRAEIADQIVDFLPEMTRAAIQTSNTEHRRQVLERLTRSEPGPSTQPESPPE